jgi:transcriptional regulator with XRE-family HTH domain
MAQRPQTIKGETLGDIIQSARKARGWSQRFAAVQWRISLTHAHDIEHDRRAVSETLVLRLAESLGLDVELLMSLAGRLGETVEAYLARHPPAVVLIRAIAAARLTDRELEELTKRVREMGAGRAPRESEGT